MCIEVCVHVCTYDCCLTQQPPESTIHLLPFMLPVGDDDLKGLYQKVRNAVVGIHKQNHRNNVKELERIATEWLVHF